MLHIVNANTDPNFNIAVEKYLIRYFPHDLFMLWQNKPSVIIGKHQMVEREVNEDFARENHIIIARRVSGGGAVYNDLGNLNLTFIERNTKGDFSKYPRKLIDFLATVGIEAEEDGRMGLTIGGRKISGSAQYRYKDVSLFHATMLFSSDLSMLESVLKRGKAYDGPYVPSVYSPVTNIVQHLKRPIELNEFKERIHFYFKGEPYYFGESEVNTIESIR